MKMKSKGKVYPSPASASSPETDAFAVLKLLPAAILALASVLSLEDREVLAYLITRSLKTTTTTTAVPDSKKKAAKKPAGNGSSAAAAKTHKPPMFDCECFDCYTSYWFRWDSSPNRELINQAIEAFEDHLASGEKPKKTPRGKRRDKSGRRVSPEEKPAPSSPEPPSPETPASPSTPQPDSPARTNDEPEKSIGEVVDVVAAAATVTEEEKEIVMAAIGHKGLARKVLPDVMGLFNSRLWSLWSPNPY